MENLKPKVLIVDDEPAVLEVYKTKLTIDGFSVLTAPDGERGLELALSEKPRVILLDIIMPKFNGLDVLAQLKKRPETKDIPTYLLTNLPEEASGKKAKELGAAGYLVKAENEPGMVSELLRKKFLK